MQMEEIEKILIRIKKNLKRPERHTISVDWKIQHEKHVETPQSDLQAQQNSYQQPSKASLDVDKFILKFTRKDKA